MVKKEIFDENVALIWSADRLYKETVNFHTNFGVSKETDISIRIIF